MLLNYALSSVFDAMLAYFLWRLFLRLDEEIKRLP
jgi:hypothetical protein